MDCRQPPALQPRQTAHEPRVVAVLRRQAEGHLERVRCVLLRHPLVLFPGLVAFEKDAADAAPNSRRCIFSSIFADEPSPTAPASPFQPDPAFLSKRVSLVPRPDALQTLFQRLSKSQFHSILTGPIVPGWPVSSSLSVSIVIRPCLPNLTHAPPAHRAQNCVPGRVRRRRSTRRPVVTCRLPPPPSRPAVVNRPEATASWKRASLRPLARADDELAYVHAGEASVPTLTPVAHERLFRVWRWRKRSIRRVLDRHCGARGISEWLFRVRRRS